VLTVKICARAFKQVPLRASGVAVQKPSGYAWQAPCRENEPLSHKIMSAGGDGCRFIMQPLDRALEPLRPAIVILFL
jgi:hypothetical protein